MVVVARVVAGHPGDHPDVQVIVPPQLGEVAPVRRPSARAVATAPADRRSGRRAPAARPGPDRSRTAGSCGDLGEREQRAGLRPRMRDPHGLAKVGLGGQHHRPVRAVDEPVDAEGADHRVDGAGSVGRVSRKTSGIAEAAPPRATSRSRCRGARPASIAKHTRRRGCTRPQGRERVPRHVHAGDVAGERRPPAGRGDALPRWSARAAPGRPGCTNNGAPRSPRTRAAARSAPCPPRRRALRRRHRPTKPLSRSSPSSPGSGASRLGAAHARSSAGNAAAPSCQASSSGCASAGWSASMPSGLEGATQARSRPSYPTSSARRTGSWSAGSKPHSGSPGVAVPALVPAAHRGGSLRREARDQRLGPEMLMYVYPQGLVKGFSETFK